MSAGSGDADLFLDVPSAMVVVGWAGGLGEGDEKGEESASESGTVRDGGFEVIVLWWMCVECG